MVGALVDTVCLEFEAQHFRKFAAPGWERRIRPGREPVS